MRVYTFSTRNRGASLLRSLKKLARAHPKAIAEVRGLGLMIGIEMQGPAGPVVKALRERGILAIKAGDRVLRFLPPLTVGSGEVKRVLGITPVPGRVGQRSDDLLELQERARPPLRDDQGHRGRGRRAGVHQVDGDLVDHGAEMLEPAQPPLGRLPAVVRTPIAQRSYR